MLHALRSKTHNELSATALLFVSRSQSSAFSKSRLSSLSFSIEIICPNDIQIVILIITKINT